MYQVNQMSPASRVSRTERVRRTDPPPLPEAGSAEVSIVAGSPEAARQIADMLGEHFRATEQRSYPTGSDGVTRLRLNVSTVVPHPPAVAP